MNDDANKKLEKDTVVSNNEMVEDSKVEVSVPSNITSEVASDVSGEGVGAISEQVVEEVSLVDGSDDNKKGIVEGSSDIKEISVEANSESLDDVVVSSDSVFNKQDDVVTQSSLKEGQEHLNDKKGFPYGMVIIFVILIICAFFIDNIVGIIEDLGKDKTKEENEVVEQGNNEESNDGQDINNKEDSQDNNENDMVNDDSSEDTVNDNIDEENNDNELSETGN